MSLDPISFIAQYGETATLKSRSLDTGSRDAVTGWPPVSWTDSEIKLIVGEMAIRKVATPGGSVDEIRLMVQTVASTNKNDQVVLRGFTYKVEFTPKPYADKGVVLYYGLTLLKVS